MTPEEQRIALCEWMGYKHQKGEEPSYGGAPQNIEGWFRPDGRFVRSLPDTNSLDVLHEMEMKLDAISDNYLSSPQPNRIYRVMLADRVAGKKLWDNGTFIGSQWDVYGAISATAAQRRETLCRTLFPERFKSCKTGTANAQ